MTVQLLKTVYRGGRSSCFVFHPAKQPNLDTRYMESKAIFMSQLNTWYEVCELYRDDMVLSENITPASLKKDVLKMIAELDIEKDVYKLEALAEALWDKDGAQQNADGSFEKGSEKIEQHYLPTMAELDKRAKEILSDDVGIQLSQVTPASGVARRTWTG